MISVELDVADCESSFFWPQEHEAGLIKTRNAMGIMTSELAPVAIQFCDYGKNKEKPLLDIGAAYGAATHFALHQGAKVIACDISMEHLLILKNTTPLYVRDRLMIDNSSFPFDSKYTDSSLSGILLSLVLHFMDGDTVDVGLSKCFDWLEPGGKIFIVVMTPNLSFYKKAWPEYKKNLLAKAKWPGVFCTKDVATEDFWNELPSMVHLFDKNTIKRACENSGFKIEQCDYFCYNKFPDRHRNNGKEFIGVVAKKI